MHVQSLNKKPGVEANSYRMLRNGLHFVTLQQYFGTVYVYS